MVPPAPTQGSPESDKCPCPCPDCKQRGWHRKHEKHIRAPLVEIKEFPFAETHCANPETCPVCSPQPPDNQAAAAAPEPWDCKCAFEEHEKGCPHAPQAAAPGWLREAYFGGHPDSCLCDTVNMDACDEAILASLAAAFDAQAGRLREERDEARKALGMAVMACGEAVQRAEAAESRLRYEKLESVALGEEAARLGRKADELESRLRQAEEELKAARAWQEGLKEQLATVAGPALDDVRARLKAAEERAATLKHENARLREDLEGVMSAQQTADENDALRAQVARLEKQLRRKA